MFNVTFKINEKDITDIEHMPKEFREGLIKGTRRAMLFAEGKAKRRFNTPGNLKVRTGHYRRSIRSGLLPAAGGIIGFVTADVVYASIHEYGGTIYPKKGKYLRFPIDGKWVTVTKVVIPKRPIITPAITENIEAIDKIIVEDIIKEVGGE